MNAARTDWQAILASFADEIQPLLAVVASSLDRLVEQPHDALAATTGLAQLQTLQASASMMTVDGFEALLETTRAALETVIGSGPLSLKQRAAGRELGNLLLREGEAIGLGEPAPAPPPRAAELLLLLRADTPHGVATVAPPAAGPAAAPDARAATIGPMTAADDLERWLNTLLLTPEPGTEPAGPAREPAEIAAEPVAAGAAHDLDEPASATAPDEAREALASVAPPAAADAPASAAGTAASDDTAELPDAARLPAAAAEPVAADATVADAEERAPVAARWMDEAANLAMALAPDPPPAEAELAALASGPATPEAPPAASHLDALLAALEEVAGEPVGVRDGVEATVAWQSADDDATLEIASLDLDAALGTLGGDEPAAPAEPDFAVAATAAFAEPASAPEAFPGLVLETIAEPDIAWSLESNGNGHATPSDAALLAEAIAPPPESAPLAALLVTSSDVAPEAFAESAAVGTPADLGTPASADAAAEVHQPDLARLVAAPVAADALAAAAPAAEPAASGPPDSALTELLASLREVTGQPLSDADRAELITAWHEEPPEAVAADALTSESTATDDSLKEPETALAFDDLLSTLDAADEPVAAAVLAADTAAAPLALPQRVEIARFMTKWADALETDAEALERFELAAAAVAPPTDAAAWTAPLAAVAAAEEAPAISGGEPLPAVDDAAAVADAVWPTGGATSEPAALEALPALAEPVGEAPPAEAEVADEIVALPAERAGEAFETVGLSTAADDDVLLDDPAFADLLATLDEGAAAVDAPLSIAGAASGAVEGYAQPSEVEWYVSEPGRQVAAWAAQPAPRDRGVPAGADEPEALAVFATERVRLVEAVADARAALEAAPDDEMALTDLTWATHTLRGAASLVGADAISEVCGLVERALEQFSAQPLPLEPPALAFLATAEAVLQELLDTSAGADDMVALVAAQYMALQGAADQAPSAPAGAGWGDLPPELAAQLDGVDVTELDEATLAQLAEVLAAHDAAREANSVASIGTEAPGPVALPELLGDDLTSPWALPTDLGDAPNDDPLGFASDADFEAELRATFLGEAEEHLTTINGALLALESNPGDAARLIAVRRAVHTLKSASGVVGLAAVSAFCHIWEDALECVEEETGASPPELSLLLECAEALERYFQDVDADATAAEAAFAPLIERLREAAGLAPEAAPTANLAAERALGEPWATPASGVVLGVTATEPPDADGAAPADDGEEPAPTARAAAEPRASAEMLRVPLGRVDGMIDLVGELVLQRSGLVQRLEALRLGVEDLAPSLERLRRLGVDLEDRFVASDEARSPAQRQGGTTGSAAEFDELEFDRYNPANLLARELSELAADLATTRRELGHLVEDARLAVTRQARATADLHDELLDARLVPLSQLTLRLQRTVRQVALRSGKEVTFALDGGDTLLDKTLLEQIADPLLHLLRNAVDHGIEPADERVARGKSPTGSVRVVAGRDGHEVVVRVCDDGAGIDTARVLAQARARGLIADESPEAALAHELIFAPGLSTSSALTDLSGRGIGLDAVRAHLARAKGTVAVSSSPGKGTVFTLRLPSLLVVTPSLVVAAGGQRLALPLAQVRHVLRVPREQVLLVGDTRLLPLDGDNVLIRSLGGLLGWPAIDDEVSQATVLLVVVAVGERQVALEVDDVFGQHEMVVKTPAPPFDVLPGLAGASVQGNGEVILVLNLLELVSEPGGRPRGVPLPPPPSGGLEPPTVLVVDDSLSVRRVVVRALERHGWRAHEARDGVHALEVLRRVSPDVVLLDIEMPRMDGYELAGILKKQDSFQGIPIVMLTSRGGEKHRRKAFDLGVDAYLVKPYQEAELLHILRQVALAVPAGVA